MSIDSAKIEPVNIDAVQKKKTVPRPSMQIYKPPGLRNPTNATSSQTKPSKDDSVGSEPKPSTTPEKKPPPPNPSPVKNIPETSSKQNTKSKPVQTTEQKPNLTGRTLSNVVKETRKKALIQKDVDEIVQTFKKLNISKEKQLIDNFLASNMENEQFARSLGQYLVQYAIEENKTHGRTVARLCASLLECPSGIAFHQGLVTAILQYYDCRDQLRTDHLRVWVGFLNFISDLYAHVGFTYEGEMVEVIFNIFEYMLKRPVLETLKIEELECMIASLLSVGYDLERQCPDELGRLKNQIRDAFIEVSEPWARKMILLLMELSASGWTLPPESNDYYFG
uniref:MIF4G domain-containing protein n=1 Tax=Panagrolaimus sp. JU765 TaxID=591449 RepID=A0AC34QHK9_9BILA